MEILRRDSDRAKALGTAFENVQRSAADSNGRALLQWAITQLALMNTAQADAELERAKQELSAAFKSDPRDYSIAELSNQVQQATVSEPLARRILHEDEATQIALVHTYLDEGAPEELGDAISMLILNRSALILPIMESRAEEILKDQYSSRTAHPNLVPDRVLNIVLAAIPAGGDAVALRMASRLMAIDEARFGHLVGDTLAAAYNLRNPITVAYDGLDLGDPRVGARLAEWVESAIKTPTGIKAAQTKLWWSEALAKRYDGPPTDAQWATDPLVERLGSSAQAVKNEVLRLTAAAVEKGARK